MYLTECCHGILQNYKLYEWERSNISLNLSDNNAKIEKWL